jgi:signal transduction histidine kinase
LSGSVVLVDRQRNIIRAAAVTKSKENELALEIIGAKLEQLEISLNDNNNLIVKAVKSAEIQKTNNLYEFLRPLVTEENATKIQELTTIKSTFVYPLSLGTNVLGAFSISTNREIEDLTEIELEMLKRVDNVFSVAIDRLTLYQDLQYANNKLKEMDKQKDEFLSMAAHELRAPMTAIKGYVSMVLEGDTGDIPEKARGFLADTSNITDRLIRLVNNMLNVGRIEEGRMTFQDEVENLSVSTRSVFSQFTPEAERKGLKYTLEIPQELRDKVRIDPDRIQEVVGNFISNSIKYTNEGFVTVKMIQSDPQTVRVEVIDSGPGISPEEQKNLFQKFHRVESNVGKTTGTGLGLYISKLLVEKFNGKIGVNSDLGKGSTFWFELPLAS